MTKLMVEFLNQKNSTIFLLVFPIKTQEDGMETYIVYFDETGDDGANTLSSKQFVLTSIYLNADCWQENYNKIREFRKNLKKKYGLHIKEEIHTKHLVRDKGMYRSYGWNNDQRKQLLIDITKLISSLDIRVINVIIDKERIKNTDYPVLKNALTYNIQRIENDSAGKWHYLIITDEGRLAPMRKTAREIRAFNPIQSHFGGYQNSPIKGLIEDIMAKESTESYFIQICDFVSFFTDLYYRVVDKKEKLPKRVERIVDEEFIRRVMVTFKKGNVLNLKASNTHPFGYVIYPK